MGGDSKITLPEVKATSSVTSKRRTPDLTRIKVKIQSSSTRNNRNEFQQFKKDILHGEDLPRLTRPVRTHGDMTSFSVLDSLPNFKSDFLVTTINQSPLPTDKMLDKKTAAFIMKERFELFKKALRVQEDGQKVTLPKSQSATLRKNQLRDQQFQVQSVKLPESRKFRQTISVSKNDEEEPELSKISIEQTRKEDTSSRDALKNSRAADEAPAMVQSGRLEVVSEPIASPALLRNVARTRTLQQRGGSIGRVPGRRRQGGGGGITRPAGGGAGTSSGGSPLHVFTRTPASTRVLPGPVRVQHLPSPPQSSPHIIPSSPEVSVELPGIPTTTRVTSPNVQNTPSGADDETSDPAVSSNTPSTLQNVIQLLNSRLGAGVVQEYDPSIIVDFLTVTALTKMRRRPPGAPAISASTVEADGGTDTRATSEGGVTPSLDEEETSGQDFGPLSDGADRTKGVDPATIPLPPMLRQTLYSYLLPRLLTLEGLLETVPGVPGLDYPIIAAVPYTNFYCSSMPWPGFYADTETRCQAWHYCDLDGRQASFLCPNGTVFNQAFMVCDWWFNSDCQTAPYLYALNERIFDLPEVEETAPHRTLTIETLDTLFL